MIDMDKEETIDMSEVAALPMIRQRYKRLSLSAIYSWANHGKKSKGAELVVLETLPFEWGTLTSKEAVQRFLDKLDQKSVSTPCLLLGVAATLRDLALRYSNRS